MESFAGKRSEGSVEEDGKPGGEGERRSDGKK
jgi:hypothetical protein